MEETKNILDGCQCRYEGHCPIFDWPMTKNLFHKCQNDHKFRANFAKIHGVTELKQEENLFVAEPNKEKLNEEEAIAEIESEGYSLDDDMSKGLGDTIEKVLKKFGITDERINKIMGDSECGCTDRKKWFNKIFSYKKDKPKESE